jgi:hypothetical protein
MNFQKFTTFKTILIALVLTINANQLIAQNTNGIFFQAVARDNYANPAKDRKIYVQSSILQTTPTGTKVLTEEHQASTDASGVFSISLGNGVRVGGTASGLTTIDWSKGPFYLNLKVAITPIGGNSSWDYNKEWVDMGTTSFGAVPFALYSASSAKVDDKLNVSDTTTMLKVYAKAIKVQSLETAVASKLTAADTLTMLAPYAKAAYTIDSSFFKSQLATKLSISDTINYTKQKYTDSAIAKKLNISDSTKYITPAQLSKYNFSSGGGGATMDTSSLSNRINLKANKIELTSAFDSLNTKIITSITSITSNTASITTNRSNITLNTASIASNTASITANTTAIASEAATARAAELILTNNIAANTLSITANATAINLKANTADVNTSLATKVDKVTGKDLSTNDYTTAEKTKLAAITGTNTGDQTDITGNAATATKLATAKNINGVAFDGSADITITATANAGTLTGTTLAANVVNSSLTSVGTLTSGTISLTSNIATSGTLKAGAITYPNTDGTNGQVLTSNGAGNASWISPTSVSVGTISSTSNANGATITSGVLNLTPADETNGGIITTGTQSFAGLKTFNDGINYIKVSSSPTLDQSNTTSYGSTAGQSDWQSFIAGINGILSSVEWNMGSPLDPASAAPVTVKIYNGEGTNGTLLGTANGMTPATNDFRAFEYVTFDLSSSNIKVIAGQLYTIQLTTPTVQTLFLSINNSNPYANGRASVNPNVDFVFKTNVKAFSTDSYLPLSGGALTGNLSTSGTLTAGAVTYPNLDGSTNQVLITNGNGVASFASIPTLNQNTTGTAYNVTGVVAVANGGTGATSLTGLVKGTGTSALTAAVAGSDYQAPITLTTTGTGAATLSGTTLNIPAVSSTVNAGSISGTVAVANGGTGTTSLTGLVKGTGTSALTAAVAGSDYLAPNGSAASLTNFPTFNQNTTGNAATVTTNANLNGDVTSVGNTSTVVKINGTSLASLSTGILKNTTSTGVPTIAVAGTDYQAPITLTTTGSGSATLSGTTINIPKSVPYSGASGAVNLGAYNLTVNSLTIGQGGRSSNNNTAVGIGVLPSTTSGNNNTGLGSSALAANTGDNNVGIGFQALKLNTSGGNNIAIGQNAANSNLTGSNNVAIGFQTAFWASESDNITAVGSMALNAEKGAGNTAIGVGAGKVGSGGPYINTTNSTFLGFNTTTGKTTDVTITNATAIGYGATVTASNNIQLGNTTVTNVNTSGALTTGTVTYPSVHGTRGQVLTSTGSGTLTWTNSTADAGTLTGTTLNSSVTGSSLTSVGTITSGVWSGTAVAVEKGGTGLTSAGTSGQVLTSTGSGTLTWTTSTADAGTLTGTTLNSSVTGSSLTSVGTLNSATVNGKVIVGASSAASASAVLEANSTTQGFLPPRMSGAQRDAISSKVAGLVVWCSNCGSKGELQVFNGTEWTNIIGGRASLYVGMEYQGGIIAYILQNGDPGFDANIQHGLIAATFDQGSSEWNDYTITGATGTAIGTGLSNTNAIIASQGTPSIRYAAGLARAYREGGYEDWYLPSQDELSKLYLNRVAIGGFAKVYYWSSTEYGDYDAWTQSFDGGTQSLNDKVNTSYVRAIRAF